MCIRDSSKYFNVQCHYYAIHLKYSPFICSKCPKTFNQKSHLVDHLINHHSITKEQAKEETKNLKFSVKEAKELFPDAPIPIDTSSTNVPNVPNVPTNHSNIEEINENPQEIIDENPASTTTTPMEQEIKPTALIIKKKEKGLFNPLDYPKVTFKCMNCIYEFDTSDAMIDHHLSKHEKSLFAGFDAATNGVASNPMLVD